MTTKSERYGKVTLRWQASRDGGFAGTVIVDRQRSEVLTDENEARLVARLRNEAGKLDPNYLGMDGAIARFLEFMPGGLRGDRNVSQERDYKLEASRVLNSILPLEAALQATEMDARAVRRASVWLNILSPYESMHMKQVLENPEGPAFLRSAARFASGDYGAGAQGMENALKKYGRQSWPKASYLGYLWRPADNMFCKPTVTQDFAQRIGHEFHHVYSPEINERVYLSLMDLADQTLARTRAFGAEDYIDVQTFIYVVGGYTDADRPEGRE
jgi:energy-coupling factor transporter ATP-binding protein EcfA2